MKKYFTLNKAELLVIIGLSICTTLATLTISEDSLLLPARWVLGLIFCFFIPGYCLLGALFPSKEMDMVERFILSVGLSLAILPIIGIILSITIGRIDSQTTVLSLLVFTILTYLLNLRRSYQIKN